MLERELLAELNHATTPLARPNPLVALWRWRYETAALVLAGALARAVVVATGPALIAMAAVLAMVALWPPARSEVWGRIRCVVTAHRIRVGFVEAYLVNRRGKIPAVLWCAPAPFGERVWVWCRAGITADDLERGRSVIAGACWAADALVWPHPRKPHYVLVEVIRTGRDPAVGQADRLPVRGVP
ncbi:hypothetical protein [Nonomuraea sp. NPDC048826]|uniref:hypothetical protein n=1 Tax=Nonomuraea sp. NPDC048826 TaxID=3364347 RepID=UPI00371CC044